MVEPGEVLLGKYRVERVLGKGGMGMVACARHLDLHQRVAIKLLLPKVMENESIVMRFRREARAMVQLKSEHVSRVIDVGTLESGVPYMVMEYLEGTDLGQLLRERGPLGPGFAVDLLLQACEALAEAHALGIVHRDIKPSNFFLTRGADGAPLLKVLDFGISKALEPMDDGITTSQAIMGTPSYMSPEQMRSSKHVDARTDIWALGVALYELVSGRRPFRGDSFAGLCLAVATSPMLPLDDVELPGGLEDVIARCLEKEPERRFASVAELSAALASHARTRDQGARTRVRTARMLGLDAPPTVSVHVRSAPHRQAEPQESTLRESMGEPSTQSYEPGARLVHGVMFPEALRGARPAGGTRPRLRRAQMVIATGVLAAAIVVAAGILHRGDSPRVIERPAHERVMYPRAHEPADAGVDMGLEPAPGACADAGEPVPGTDGAAQISGSEAAAGASGPRRRAEPRTERPDRAQGDARGEPGCAARARAARPGRAAPQGVRAPGAADIRGEARGSLAR